MAYGMILNDAFTAMGQATAHEDLHIGEFVAVTYSADGAVTAAPTAGADNIWFVDAGIDVAPEEGIADVEYVIQKDTQPILKKLYPGCRGITTAVDNYSTVSVNDVLMVSAEKKLTTNADGKFTVSVIEKLDDHAGENENAIRFVVLDPGVQEVTNNG